MTTASVSPAVRVMDLLTPEERRCLTARSDFRAAAMVLATWLVILGLLGLAGFYPSWWTVVLVFLVLPGRQLSLAVLMHEAGHGTLFQHAGLNQWVGQWLCALPTFGDVESYARGHREHHKKAGSRDDPDLPNYAAYPVSISSFKRKILRDLTGQTGLKLLAGLFRGATDILGNDAGRGRSVLPAQIAAQLVLAGVLWLMGIGWTYWLWLGTFLTTYMLVIRLRQVAEHAAVPNLYDLDPRLNTRTVDAPWWQRVLIAPSFVNFHMEHHLMASVPCYRLRAFRELLKQRGFLDNVPVFTSYVQVLRSAVVSA